MSSFHSVVTEQREFICAVCAFIGDLVRAALPDIAWDNALLPDEESIRRVLDGVIERHAKEGANDGDCRLAMAQATCVRMKRVCDLLKRISESVGLADVAGKYLDAPWFIDLLFRKDTSKLNKLCYTIDLTDEKPSRLLMNVAAILEGRKDGYDAMSARAKRKADRETRDLIREVGASMERKLDASKKEIVGKVEAVREELHETKEELLARADAMLKKLGKVKLAGKRNSTHTLEQKKTCWALWNEAQNNAELKSGTRTGDATYEAAFNWYKRSLALVGVTKLDKFIKIIRSIRVKKCVDQKAALEAKIEAARKKKPATRNPQPATRKCGIIRGMKRIARAVVFVAFGAFGAAHGAALPQLPDPAFADTEVCTNVPCATLLSDVRELEVVIDFAGTESNCVQVAFGRDADGDGDLSANEADVVMGWRAGDCFIEDVKGGRRFQEAASATSSMHRIELRATAGNSGARSARVMCDGAAKFAGALGGDLRWLCRRDWNMAKVTRRGADSPGEIVFVASDHGGMKFIMR